MGDRIQLRRGPAQAWEDNNPILGEGEPGLETDTGLLKVGDGVTEYQRLPYTVIDSTVFVSNAVVRIDKTRATTPQPGTVWFYADDLPTVEEIIPGDPAAPTAPPPPLVFFGTVDTAAFGSLVAAGSGESAVVVGPLVPSTTLAPSTTLTPRSA